MPGVGDVLCMMQLFSKGGEGASWLCDFVTESAAVLWSTDFIGSRS